MDFDQFLSFYKKHPKLENKDFYAEFPSVPKGTIRYWKMKATKVINNSPNNVDNTKIKGKEKDLMPLIPPKTANPPSQPIIDDPNELVMDISMKVLQRQRYELMKHGKIPDSRWGTILINILKETKTLEAKSDSDTISQLKQHSTQEILDLRKKLIGNLQDVG